PDTAVMEACRKTGLSDLIAQHPKGLDLLISEGGAGVSDGQRQLIGVTRLMLASPRIWLLDEPTSSMDDRFEQRVMKAFAEQIGAEDTLVLVTHKPALLRLVDRIVVLTPGGVALDGARDQVLNSLRNPGAAQPRPSAPTKSHHEPTGTP
ncbi:MAG: ATP-binding cassette domain-containing protein, partial [Chlorobiales bacterium]|nr:ATP-binding cassette domain-containing protein [Chlorobiales bacterium]